MPICAYCGKMFKKLTDDHVPPKCLFGKNLNCNLITVPSCHPCNANTSKDDEYFRTIAFDHVASQTQAGWEANQSTLRAMNRVDRPKFGAMIRGMMHVNELQTQSGLFAGWGTTLRLDYPRILKTAEKIIRGLFYHTTGQPLCRDYSVWCRLGNLGFEELPSEARAVLERDVIPELATKPIIHVGSQVFRFRYGLSQDDENAAFFLLGFYERFDFVGFTYPTNYAPEQMTA